MSKIFSNSIVNSAKISRFISSSSTRCNNEINTVVTNRNPRNLEKMRIAYKPDGFHLEKPGNCYWHKLVLTTSGRHITATIQHFQNGEVLSASTKEWAVKKQLYRTTDASAYMNLGKVLAQRCLEYGLTELRCDIKAENDGKIAGFLNALTENGVSLNEPTQFKIARPWDQLRPEKPWEITE